MNSSIIFRTIFFIALISGLSSMKPGSKPARSIYQLTVYHYNTAEQEKVLDGYLQNALLPALHRQQIKNIGVFKNHANDTATDKTLYVYTLYTTLNSIITVAEKLKADKEYQSAGADYINAVYNNAPYTRMENILLQAFPLARQMELPDLKNDRKERVYELRSYESATEKIFANKVHMFNQGDEIGLFKRLHFNAVFYGEVLSGSKMPNLMYMTCHENKAAREVNWKNFVDSPEWKKLISMPEYNNNVSHIDISFLYPTAYSDF